MAGGQKRTFDDSGLGSETSRAYRTSPSISDLGDSDHDRESSLEPSLLRNESFPKLEGAELKILTEYQSELEPTVDKFISQLRSYTSISQRYASGARASAAYWKRNLHEAREELKNAKDVEREAISEVIEAQKLEIECGKCKAEEARAKVSRAKKKGLDCVRRVNAATDKVERVEAEYNHAEIAVAGYVSLDKRHHAMLDKAQGHIFEISNPVDRPEN